MLIKFLKRLPPERLGVLSIILSAVLFGTMPLLTKTAFKFGSNPFTAVFGRYFTGSMAIFIMLAFKSGGLAKAANFIKLTRIQAMKLIGLSIFFTATPALLYLSYKFINSGLCTALHFTYPVLVILLIAISTRTALKRQELICCALCLTGILLITNVGFGAGTGGESPSLFGVAIAALSALTFAIYIVLLGRSGIKLMHPLKITFWLSLISSLEIFIIAAATGNFAFGLPWQAWAAHVGLGVVATAFAAVLFQEGICLCGEVKTALLSNFEPLTSVVIGILIYHEALTWRTALGVAAILVAASLTAGIKTVK